MSTPVLFTWEFLREIRPYHTLLAFLYVFAIPTVTMETLLATTLVRSNGICAKGMRAAFVFV